MCLLSLVAQDALEPITLPNAAEAEVVFFTTQASFCLEELYP
jgi:hypothetical protein